MTRLIKQLIPVAIIMISLYSSGCLYFKNYPIGIEPAARELGNKQYEIIGPATGSSSSFILFGFFKVTNPMSYNEAIEQAIRSQGGDNLIEVTSWLQRDIYIVGEVETLYVSGKVVRYIR
jgi:hypothetical protein